MCLLISENVVSTSTSQHPIVLDGMNHSECLYLEVEQHDMWPLHD